MHRDIGGDAFFLVVVLANRNKDWVNRMVVPYCVFFALGSAASTLSVLIKLRMVFNKLRERFRPEVFQRLRWASLGGVRLSPRQSHALASSQQLQRQKSDALKKKFENRKLVRPARLACCIGGR
jgi:hypothetical protein